MRGAEALIRTLVASGVDTCFMNPGTSEMHFVASLDAVPEMRGVLALFEGVATGAADGFARMAGRPAAVLLHLGPGLGNGLANLHNARKGDVPVVAIVGDHATHHKQYDTQLESDIETVARNVSTWIRRSAAAGELPSDAAAAVAAALGPPGRVATLILSADVSWSEGAEPAPPAGLDGAADGRPRRRRAPWRRSCAAVSRRGCCSAVGPSASAGCGPPGGSPRPPGPSCWPRRSPPGSSGAAGSRRRPGSPTSPSSRSCSSSRSATSCSSTRRPRCRSSPTRAVRASWSPTAARSSELATAAHDVDGGARGAGRRPRRAGAADPWRQRAGRSDPPGRSPRSRWPPRSALCCPRAPSSSDEAQTAGLFTAGATVGCPRHSWLCLTGGAIGQGLPVATGAAVAAPDRRVLALEADGSALYTIQSLWTQAREGLDVTTIICNNRAYSVLEMELDRVGADEPGPRAQAMLDLHGPDLDFVRIAEGLGVPATRAETADELVVQLERALAEPGPNLIEAIVPPLG